MMIVWNRMSIEMDSGLCLSCRFKTWYGNSDAFYCLKHFNQVTIATVLCFIAIPQKSITLRSGWFFSLSFCQNIWPLSHLSTRYCSSGIQVGCSHSQLCIFWQALIFIHGILPWTSHPFCVFSLKQALSCKPDTIFHFTATSLILI